MASKRFKSGSSSKPQEHYRIAENDRISILPDSILCHILSFLPTKDSVKTSILSRRWRFTWTSVAALDLDALDLNDLYCPRGKSRSKKPFKNFVKMVLIRHSHPCVQRFRLRPGNSYPTSVVNPWISYAITHNVEKLDLCMQGNVKLPPTLFNCTTIRVLKLADGIDLDVPESVSLPTLKVVHFQSLQSLCDDNINRILSGSPILEKLEIGRSGSADGVNIFSIVSSSLKTLIITTQCKYCNPYGVVIDAPKLEYLELRDRRSQFMLDCSVEIKNAPSLVKLLLDFSCSDGDHMPNLVNMTWNLYEMQNVKVLSAPSCMLQNLLSYHYANICFSNLTQLTVRYCREDLSVLPQILTGLPNLEVLILDKMFNYYLITSEDWEQEKIEISCLKCSLKLKRLEFKQFEANEVQMQILEYFLENATDLNEIRLGTRSRSPRESAFLNKLFNNPRCSKSFKIIIS